MKRRANKTSESNNIEAEAEIEENTSAGEINYTEVGNADDPYINEPCLTINKDFYLYSEECNQLEVSETKENTPCPQLILDCGSTVHVLNFTKGVTNIRNRKTLVKTISGKIITEQIGDFKMNKYITLKDAVIIPKSHRNLISARLLTEQGFTIHLGQNNFIEKEDGTIVAEFIVKSGLFIMKQQQQHLTDTEVNNTEHITKNISTNTQPIYLRIMNDHIKRGHLGYTRLHALREYNNYTLEFIKSITSKCHTCAKGKVNKNHGKRKTTIKTTKLGERIAADIFGPIQNRYGIIARDIHTGYITERILESRSEASSQLITILKELQNLLKLKDLSLCYIRTDNEFNTKEFSQFCTTNGLIHERTAPHSSYQNPVAESTIGHIKQKMKLLFIDSGIPKTLWVEMSKYVIFLHNLTIRKGFNKSPRELFTSYEDYDIESLLSFGCQAFTYNYHC